MWLRMAAVAVLAAVPGVSAWAGTPVLTLDDAFARVARQHPELRLIEAQREQQRAQMDLAALRPQTQIGLDIENALGSGELRGFDAAEITLGLAGVLERGGKLEARRALASEQLRALDLPAEARRLDLLAETARRYLAIAVAQGQLAASEAEIAQRQRTVAAAQQRFAAGASPESVVLTAQAALARAELVRAREQVQMESARRHLALLWGQAGADFDLVAGQPLALPAIADFDAIAARVRNSPELAAFADQQRIAEARLQLARSERSPDLAWQVGVRRLQDGGDTGLVASLSLPLGSARRADPAMRSAQAELAQIEIQREVQGLSLQATLADAHGRYRTAQTEVAQLQAQVIPRLGKAERAAERAYRAGALSYLEWAQLQTELAAARRQQWDAAADAQRALIEIQRLTAQPFVLEAAVIGEHP